MNDLHVCRLVAKLKHITEQYEAREEVRQYDGGLLLSTDSVAVVCSILRNW